MFGGGDSGDDLFDEDRPHHAHQPHIDYDDENVRPTIQTNREHGERGDEPELAVDVYQTQDDIVVKALIAGVVGPNLDLTLTREMLSISGTRQEEKEAGEEHYFQRELYWGPFSRTIMLPEEVDVDMAEATESHGILTIRLPKVNKKRQTKLKVRSK